MRLHHLAVLCSDPLKLADFYRGTLGLRSDKIHYFEDGTVRSVWLRSEEGTLLMFERQSHSLRASDGAPGWLMLAFDVTAGERERLRLELETLGYPETHRTPNTSYFLDPEGNRFALSQYR